MTFFDSLRVLRRHWLVIAAAVAAGLLSGWVTAPGDTGPPGYRATHTMIVNPSGPGINLEQAALLATTGAVPQRVGDRLDMVPERVARRVSSTADRQVASLTLTGRSPAPDDAEALADVTAEELVVELSGTEMQRFQEEVVRLTQQVDAARARVDELSEGPGANTSGTSANAELQVARSDLTAALQALQSFQRQGEPQPPLRTIETAAARPDVPDRIRAPSGKPERAGLLGLFGLLLGLGVAFGIDRLDTRIHSRRTAEAAFGFPVLAEIPPLPRRATDELLAVTRPASPFVEAYRGLRTVVALDALAGTDTAEGQGRLYVVTSPLAGEGKTTSVAHLAAMLAEVGRSVLVVSADFRRPRLHVYFGRPRDPGLTEALSGRPDAPDLGALDLSTDVPGVQVLSSGSPVDNPAPMLERAADLLRAARGLFDFVLVDTPPLLVANDATALAQEADGVIVLARAGRTTVDAAEHAAEILRRAEVRVVGVVVNAADETPSAYRYYRYRYYAEVEVPRRGLGRRRRGRESAADSNGHTPGVSGPRSGTDADTRR